MATHSAEDQLVLDQLVYRVSRAFYEPKYIVVMDVINRLKQVRDEELALTLKLNRREIHKICGKLKEDKLIKDLTKMEARKPDQRQIPNTYYYLDYKIFVDVVKYKIHKMRGALDAVVTKQEINSPAFKCQACENTYTQVEVTHSFDPETCGFLCPNDNYPLEALTFEEDNQRQELKTKLRENIKPIVDLLKLSDNIVIEQYTESMVAKNAAARTHDDDDLAFAEDGGQQQGEIQVVFQDDNDKAAKKARDSEANLRRTQNAVPSWHAWSTVSGEMTALGAEAAKRQELPADDHNAHGDAEVQENDSERVEYYERYYEELESISQNVDESSDVTNGHVNGHSKRPHEDSEDESRKRPRDESGDLTDSFGGQDAEEETFEEEYPEVSVAGVMVPLLEITGEHQERMTPEEYQAYYEICQKYQ